MQEIKQTVLVTGASGFIGKNLVRYLRKENFEVTTLGRKDSDIILDLESGDLSALDDRNFNYVVHLAAYSSPRRSVDPVKTRNLNFEATKQLFEKVSSPHLRKIIFMSSAAVYCSSNSNLSENDKLLENSGTYVSSKLEAEELCSMLIEKGMPIVTFRLANCYGPEQQWKKEEIPTLIPEIIVGAINTGIIKVMDPRPVRDYIYVDDVCKAISMAFSSEDNGIFNLGTGIGFSVGEIASKLAELTGSKFEQPNLTEELNNKIVLDVEKIKRKMHWSPEININEGLSRTVEHYRKISK